MERDWLRMVMTDDKHDARPFKYVDTKSGIPEEFINFANILLASFRTGLT
jgi:hypothetical protein